MYSITHDSGRGQTQGGAPQGTPQNIHSINQPQSASSTSIRGTQIDTSDIRLTLAHL